ncbi:MAG: YggS family pyridoxal phosphate-dependent enzyme [Mariniblastus sp.]
MIELFKQNLNSVHQRIEDAATKSGRSVDSVNLIGVSKYVDAQTTRILAEAGCRVLGENRPQLLWEKHDALSDLPVPVRWHMIGHLQRNKVKRTVECCELIHSADSQRLLTAINSAAAAQQKKADVLLEVNVSGEDAKHGFFASDLPQVFSFVSGLESVFVKGLMCMAGLEGDLDDARREFALLKELQLKFVDDQPDNVDLKELSMGMSGDFEVAIEEGSTMVRVGSALFAGIR